jgi:hypothetical protein
MKLKILLFITAILILSLKEEIGFSQDNKIPDWAQKVEKVAGLKGVFNEKEGVFKMTSPRIDVKVTVDQTPMAPFMGLTSWAAFAKGPKNTIMVMGDVVLFQDEVNPIMSVALDNGLEVTALHNHFFFDNPKVFFMHIGGEGAAEELATAVSKILDTIKEIRTANPEPVNSFGYSGITLSSSITAKTIEDILGFKGESKEGMFKVTVGRTTKMACGCEAGKAMGVNTWAAFAGSDDKAIVDGDFVVYESELQAVLKNLRKGGINVVAIHNHMTQENPRMLFLHYWGVGPIVDLAATLRSTLDTQDKKDK